MTENRIDNLKKEFCRRFNKNNSKTIRIFSAPGRVNLIGEHTDYNDGFVLPIAIDRNILVAADLNEENMLKLHSLNFNNIAVCPLDKIEYDSKDDWANYPKGVAKVLQEKNYRLKGMNLLFDGNIPIGSGLSSSAAIEVVSCLALTTLSDIEIDKKEIPLICQKAENEFIGTKCGIMDQFVITFAKKNTALFLDCRDLTYEYIPISNSDITIVITDSKLERKLANSEYNIRRKQCEEGVKILKQYLKDIKSLRDITIEQFEEYKKKLPPVIRQRCEHVIYENERVKRSKELLKDKKFKEFGDLMIESHESLRTLYQVSSYGLDTIVETSLKVSGVLGSRMTGAGFGGCTVSLVKNYAVENFIESISMEYQKRFHKIPDFIFAIASDGAREIKQ